MRLMSEGTDAFRAYDLRIDDNLFDALRARVSFEDVGKGRQGAVLLETDEAARIPVVRTTTRYSTAAQRFQPIHAQLAQQIREVASLPAGFNNALIEIYTSAYTTMGSHSDQALDLNDDSFIALFSCYRDPDPGRPPRKLVVEPKEPGGDRFEIPLTCSRLVAFSIATNRRYRHKIVLDAPGQRIENQWLGITFRTSKTFIESRSGQPCFPDGTRLTLADEQQCREFYQLRRRENHETDFAYPRITYTLSESDLLPPVLV